MGLKFNPFTGNFDFTGSGGLGDYTPTKGNLLAGNGSTWVTVGVGTDGQTLVAASAEASGLDWTTPAGGGDVVKVGTPVNNQVGVWTGDGTIEGDAALTFDTTTDLLTSGTLRATTFTASEMVLTDASKNLVSAPVATYPSLTELTYLKGATSSLQTQINAKAPSTSPTFATSVTGSYLTASEVLITDASKNVVSAPVATYPSLTEFSYVKGVTSSIQTQLNAKGAGTVTSVAMSTPTGLTISGSPVTTTGTFALGLDTGYTIPLQSAIDAKANSSGSLTQFVGNTAWRVFYSDSLGDVTELALGADGTFLKSNGASSAPSFAVPAGSGDVSKVGTPVNNQVGVWTGDGTIEGDTALTFDTTTDTLTSGVFNGTGLTASEILITDASKNLVSAAVATYPSLTELTYVKGVTSAIQTQLGNKQASDATLTALAAYNTNGLLTQTAADTFTGSTITGTANEIAVSNGNGVSGNPTLSLPATIDLGGKTSLEIPNSAAPTVDADGEIAVDTTVTDFSHGLIKYFSGEELAVVAMPVAQFTSPTNNYVVTYDSTADEFQLKAGGSGGMPEFSVQFPTSALRVNTTLAFPPIEYVDLGTVEDYFRAFDQTTEEYVIGSFVVPADLDTAGTVTIEVFGKRKSGTGAANVGWTFGHRPIANNESLDGSYTDVDSGAKACSTTLANMDYHTFTVTVSTLAWAANDIVAFKFSRDTSVATNLADDYYLWQIRIRIPQA